jgi:polyferredoxin
MFTIPNAWNASIEILIAGIPVIGGFLLLRSEAKRREAEKRKFDKSEIVGIFFILWGFIAFVSWKEFQLPVPNLGSLLWYEGWLIPIIWGLVFTVMAYFRIRRQLRTPRG